MTNSKPKEGESTQNTNNTQQNLFNTGFAFADSSSISTDERPFYQPDEYYTLYSYPGTHMAKKVITFDERKFTTYPSSRGLFVAEIMLLYYCQQGKYPKPKSGYPGFWWFEYGIRDVGHALQSLEQRGFIRWGSKYSCLQDLKIDNLKEILREHGLPVAGNKAVLIDTIKSQVQEKDLYIPNYVPRYELTEIGQLELEQNGYVPYIHKHTHATVEGFPTNETFTVWDINKLFPDGNATDWRRIVGEIEKRRFGVDIATSNPNAPSIQKHTTVNSISQKEEMREYLDSMQETITKGINTPGDGFNEESMGLDFKKIGKDKEALAQFYIAIGKHYDATALYHHASILLRKYGLYADELSVIDSGLKVIPKNSRENLLQRRKKVMELMQKK